MPIDAQSLTSSQLWRPKTLIERAQRLLLNRSQVQLHAQSAATDSIRRNLQRDDDLSHEWRRHNMRLLYGNQPATADDAVGDTYYGDVVTNKIDRPGMGTVAKLAAAALLGLGIPAGAVLWKLPEILTALKPAAPATQPARPGSDTTLDVGLRGGEAVP